MSSGAHAEQLRWFSCADELTFPLLLSPAQRQMMKFMGTNPYNSVASIGQISSSLARSYSALWYAPPWANARYAPLEVSCAL